MAPTDTEEYEGAEKTSDEEEAQQPPVEKDQKELAFKIEELNRVIDTTEMEKKEIERFLDSIKKEREEKETSQESPEADEELPPWAAKMKEAPSEEIQPSDEEIIEEPAEGTTTPFDSGIGIPEEEPQKSIPFDKEIRAEKKSIKISPPSGIAAWLKSRAFDIFFIGAFWLIALWVASRVMRVSLFQLISAATLSVIIFYGILLVCYYFLFLLFLGETLGDHLFPEER
jgi:hypothetical protein